MASVWSFLRASSTATLCKLAHLHGQTKARARLRALAWARVFARLATVFWGLAALSSLLCVLPAAAAPKAAAAPSASTSSSATTATANAAATAAVYSERYRNTCAACHGANGRSDIAGTPVLAGQHALYAITQLFMFREGRRDNEAMVAMAKSMTDADLRGFSDYIGSLPPVPAPKTDSAPADPAAFAALFSQGQVLAQEHKCVFCHGTALDGGQGVPRIGGQKQDYLRSTLQGYKTGTRPGYTRAMTEALSQVPLEDLDVLAFFAASSGPK